MIYCHSCGKAIHETAKSRPHCDAVVKNNACTKSRIVAALLAFFSAV